ncbi:hypothetical protein [Micromonospora sp. NBC_01813]|uniref:hypothetical protein n=1 Tax=Micromonospora sp. NBC_01813 TaxID=2975988 RepID=UPI002DD7C4ED|nr:hypothetical protein [Micromonospora sp. NBC_01813]WSA08082.1 hypothetical protein OG958_28365 [Micromonospora sp. NBC_01813]
MTVTVSAGAAYHPAVTDPGHRPANGPDRVLRAVADGPLGPYPLLEAAFCWNERRPVGWRRLGPAPIGPTGPLPVVQTEQPIAAARMTRLLTTMTWAVSVPVGVATPLARIEVTAEAYHRVLRALAGAWRDGRRMLASPDLAAAHYPAALAVWRMAALLASPDPAAGVLTFSVTTPAAALLRSAAPVLALPHTVVERGVRSTVIRVDRPALFRRLLVDLDPPAFAGRVGVRRPGGRVPTAVAG